MSLQSFHFRDNQRLQKCLVSDPSHVLRNDHGEHVALIQDALKTLDGFDVSEEERDKQLYGSSTEQGVFEYKSKRNIVNFSYQRAPDKIVGKMTIRELDKEMSAHEQNRFKLLLSFGVSIPSTPKLSIIAQTHPLPAAWAQQMKAAHKPNAVVTQSLPNASPEENVKVIKRAIAAANHGLVLFSVGHGIISQGFKDQGGFDAADNKKLRIGGKGSFADASTFVDVFYDEKPPAGSTLKFSQKELDERTNPAGAKRRLQNFKLYQELCKAFVDGKVAGVVLLTCNVGNSPGFLKRVAKQWNTPIIAYKEFTSYQGGFPKGKVRSIFSSDLNKQNSKTPGSNTLFAETMFPLSLTKMVLIRP